MIRVLTLDKSTIYSFSEKTIFHRNKCEIYVNGWGSEITVLAVYKDEETAKLAMKKLFDAIEAKKEFFDFDISEVNNKGFDLENAMQEIKESKIH